jgi:uncharacterized Zn finger protein
MGRYRYNEFAPYVPVAQRRMEAARLVSKLKKKGQVLSPILIDGRVIASTFWGKSWCKNLEIYSDYENRLPRGRTYVRNGSVIDLNIGVGEVTALVSGSSIYTVRVTISQILEHKWHALVHQCSGQIGSLIELLQGKFSKRVMEIIAKTGTGLFPHPEEIQFRCSCPDYAALCKHVAAVLYGIGARLDAQPESLFALRQVNHMDLIKNAAWSMPLPDEGAPKLEGDLGALFGIDLGDSEPSMKVLPSLEHKILKKEGIKDKPKIKTKQNIKGKIRGRGERKL